jgi:uncharacterized membrane protein
MNAARPPGGGRCSPQPPPGVESTWGGPALTQESDLARLARIADSVFAVVVTLLAYRVRLPDREALAALDGPALEPFLADLGAVVLSFLVAALFWMAHWRAFRLLRRADIGLVALHFAFLGTLVLLPISTSLMSNASGPSAAGPTAYSANLFLLAGTQTLFRAHARRLLPEAFVGVRPLLTPALLTLVFAAAAVAALASPWASRALWCASLLTPIVERRWGLGRAAQDSG